MSEVDSKLDDNTWAAQVHTVGRNATVSKPPLRGQDGTCLPTRLEFESHLETKYDHGLIVCRNHSTRVRREGLVY